jgi:hypothetical protein
VKGRLKTDHWLKNLRAADGAVEMSPFAALFLALLGSALVAGQGVLAAMLGSDTDGARCLTTVVLPF